MGTIDLERVKEFAVQRHAGQFRRNGEPYVMHPIKVAELVQQVKPHSKNLDVLLATALLHDVIEDTYTSYMEIKTLFSPHVASLVIELTTAPFASEHLGKTYYLSMHMAGMTSYALVIKLADRLQNLMDMQADSSEKIVRNLEETAAIIDYLAKNRELTNTHLKLIDKINEQIKRYNL